ncbi:MAG: 5-(carboxyamino)imidazole ribonucleotide synthase [Flavobacteriaceae bacterium]|nr:5-(carboxyamino)imidazole ribonucleotide synthase [Flavobacteriaceae bacterium]
MSTFSSDFIIGILGGGQLGKMLLTETRKWDLKTAVLDPSSSAPCRLGSDVFEVGDLMDYETVYSFGKRTDLLTIEIEHVNSEALEKLEQGGILVYPSSKVLQIIQNKAKQKLFYLDNDIPTATFSRFAYGSEIPESIAHGGLDYPFVWKSAHFGYDGQGVKIVKGPEDLVGLANEECITEELVPLEKELAVIVARSVKGETRTYPVVEMDFHPEANQVEYVLCPARIPSDIAENAKKIALRLVDKLQHVGLLAVEFFLTTEGTLLVNEVAPRPHNSGHFSIEASVTNQYEQHLRAILGLPLGNTDSKIPAVMVNLVGEEGFTGPVYYEGMKEILNIPGVTPHIYGKKETRPFRKMGHVTVVASTIDQARSEAEKVKQTIRVISKES